MKRYRYIIYYEQDRTDWRDGTLVAASKQEALEKVWYTFRNSPWTPKRVDELPDTI